MENTSTPDTRQKISFPAAAGKQPVLKSKKNRRFFYHGKGNGRTGASPKRSKTAFGVSVAKAGADSGFGPAYAPAPAAHQFGVFPALPGKTSAASIGSFPPQWRSRPGGSAKLPKRAGPGRARQRRPRARGAAGPRREDGRRRAHGEGPRGSEARTDAARSGGERASDEASAAQAGSAKGPS